jgi:excisionase family DNA binding protein
VDTREQNAGATVIEPLLTFQQARDVLGVSTLTLRRFIERGDFPTPIRIGRQLRFKPDDVRDYIDRQREPAVT